MGEGKVLLSPFCQLINVEERMDRTSLFSDTAVVAGRGKNHQ